MAASPLDRTVGKTPREWAPQIAVMREYGAPAKARYRLRVRQHLLPNLGGTTWETPAPQGVGVCASISLYGWKEVIEMTDDDTGTGCVSKDAVYSITCEEENNGRRYKV